MPTNDNDIDLNATENLVFAGVKELLARGTPIGELPNEYIVELRRFPKIVARLKKDHPEIAEVVAKEVRLSAVSASLKGELIRFDAQIIGNESGKLVTVFFCYKCIYCGATVSYQNPDLFRTITTGEDKEDPNPCKQCKRRSMKRVDGECEDKDLSILYLKELPEQIDAQDSKQYDALASMNWKGYLIGITPNYQRATITAMLCRNEKTSKIEFMIEDISPLEMDGSRLNLVDAEHEDFKRQLSGAGQTIVISNQIAPHIIKADEAKLSAHLTLHSVREIQSIDGKQIRGNLHTLWPGDTKTGKSEQGKDITFMGYKIGEMGVGESSSRSGITYGISSENNAILWGILPLNDSGFVFLDGIHGMRSDDAAQMREALEQERLKVSRIVQGLHMMRVRIIATINPPGEDGMAQYPFKVQALKAMPFFKEPADITRWDLIVPFILEAVEGDEIVSAVSKERPMTMDKYKRHVLWAHTLRAHDILYTQEAKNEILAQAKELIKIRSAYPIVHNGIRDVLTRLTVAFAVFEHSVVKQGDLWRVEVRQEHARKAADFYNHTLEMLDYPEYAKATSQKMAPSELEGIVKECGANHIEILKLLQFKPYTSPALAAALGKSADSVKDYYEPLRRFGLIRTSQGTGATLTPKGVAFLRFFKSQVGEENYSTLASVGDKNATTKPQTDHPLNKYIGGGSGVSIVGEENATTTDRVEEENATTQKVYAPCGFCKEHIRCSIDAASGERICDKCREAQERATTGE